MWTKSEIRGLLYSSAQLAFLQDKGLQSITIERAHDGENNVTREDLILAPEVDTDIAGREYDHTKAQATFADALDRIGEQDVFEAFGILPGYSTAITWFHDGFVMEG